MRARVELARIDQPKTDVSAKLPAALQQEARDAAQRAHREITDGYERQAVVTEAAYLLTRANLWKDSDELLKSAIARSHSPYYLMSQLGSNARKQGHKAEALRWYEEAFNKSEGPATRLQWGRATSAPSSSWRPRTPPASRKPRASSSARRRVTRARL